MTKAKEHGTEPTERDGEDAAAEAVATAVDEEIRPPAAVEGHAEEIPAGADPADFETPGRDLVVVHPDDEGGVFQVLDRHDEDLILRELQDKLTAVMLYDFPLDGKKAIDLSIVGVKECVRWMNQTGKVQIAVDPASLQVASVTEDLGRGEEPCWQAVVYARDAVTGYGMFGSFVQAKRKHLKKDVAKKKRAAGEAVDDQDRIANPFALTTAINKAQRNALKHFIPERIRQVLIAQYKGDDEAIRTIEVGAGARSIADLPAPLTDEQADIQRDVCRGVYDEIRELAPNALLPGAFNALMARHEWSHERLDELIAHLEGLRDKLREAKDNEKKEAGR